MAKGQQVINGKAFEYALAKVYYEHIIGMGKNAVLVENDAVRQAREYYQSFNDREKEKFDRAAYETIDTMVRIEPGLLAQRNDDDVLSICLQGDAEGQKGDVRDIVFTREHPSWEIGFSAKNNNDAVKHNRLSDTIDFGQAWDLGETCSETYWGEVIPMFLRIREMIKENPKISWDEVGNKVKIEEFYKPLLKAFRDEILRIYASQPFLPQKLISYFVGNYPFYKIIKDDAHNLVIVKAFNINGMLNKTVNKVKSRYKTPVIQLPTRIIEFEMDLKHPDNTLVMTLDEGWQISFRIHSADNPIKPSFKFDVRLLGNPPILFTQHLFQE